MLDFSDYICIWDNLSFPWFLGLTKLEMSCQGGNQVKYRYKGFCQGHFKLSHKMTTNILSTHKVKKIRRAEGVENRISYTCLHGVFVFSRFFLRQKVHPPDHGIPVWEEVWPSQVYGGAVALGDASIPEKQLLPAKQQLSWELCHQGRGDSKFSAGSPVSLLLLDLFLGI